MKKIIAGLAAAALLLLPAGMAEGETAIVLGEEITVNGAAITQDASAAVYLDTRIEAHEDVSEELQGLENRVVTIADRGTYRVSGEGNDLQLRVAAGEDDEVRIVLDGTDITCRTAPAIAVLSAKEAGEAGKYGVTIEIGMAFNEITGSHTEKTEDMDVKLSGAITSLVSLGFEDGGGSLFLDGDNEGIEVKNGHLTFNGGTITVNSGDDALNASEDNVSVITINDGNIRLQVKPDKGGEGDGIDSNGSVVINGGVIESCAHPDSMDSGIDSDLGCTINGGYVLAMGNMYDEISADSKQLFMALQFAQKVEDKLVLTDLEGKVMAVAHLPDENSSYSCFVLSAPDLAEKDYHLAEGDYYLYVGGELSLEGFEMTYTPGKQMQHGGSFGGRMGFDGMGRMPENFEMPEGMQLPEGFDPSRGMPEMPEGFDPSQEMPEMPQGGFDPGRMKPGRGFGGEGEMEMSTIFHLAPGSTMFSGITAVE